ncbi:MAG: hypothetical protein PVJ57_21970 [Phycisphaerae bacterium]|jgi:hypothetical protein
MKKRRFLAGCGLILGLLTLAGCESLYDTLYQDFLEQQHAAAAAAAEFAAANPSFLYTLTASEGTLVADGGQEGAYTLTLRGLIGNVISFTDRPNRIADHESLTDFVADWEALGFTDDPPNAALALHEEDESQDVVIIELRNPVYDAAADTLTFAVTILTDEQTGALAEYFEKADAALPAAFNTCSLLIDDALPSCTIQISKDVYTSDDSIFVYVQHVDQGFPQDVAQSAEGTYFLGDNVTAFTIEKDSFPPRCITIYYTGEETGNSYAFSLSQVLDNDLPKEFLPTEGLPHIYFIQFSPPPAE